MPMYKDVDITTEFIKESFPKVADGLRGDITLDFIKNNHPNIVEDIKSEVSSQEDVSKAVMAERERILSIQALGSSGYEGVVEDAINSNKSVSETKIALFDAINAKKQDVKTAFKEDGEALAKTVAELSPSVEEDKEEAKRKESEAKREVNVQAMIGGKK